MYFVKRKLCLAILISINLITCLKTTNATIFQPIFSGHWFATPGFFTPTSVDNCGSWVFGNTRGLADDIGTAGIMIQQQYPDCTWTVNKITPINFESPTYFPGSQSQWQEMSKQTDTQTNNYVILVCKTVDGKTIHTYSGYVSPWYVCPSHTRMASTILGAQGCTDTPALCRGDVVGRNLAIPGAGFLGHVAVTESPDFSISTPGDIMEVMWPRHPLIDTTTMEAFKAATSYWGEKYGFGNIFSSYTWDQGETIMRVMEQQQSAGDGIYNFTSRFVPIQSFLAHVYDAQAKSWKLQLATTLPQFRCDTFVVWVNFKTFNRMILNFHPVLVAWNDSTQAYQYDSSLLGPADLYKNMYYERTTGSGVSNFSSVVPHDNPALINAISEVTQDLSQVTPANRNQKIMKYWQRYNQNLDQNDHALAEDALIFLKPVGLIPQLIVYYQQTAIALNKKFLLALIINSMQINPDFVDQDELSAIVKGQEFLQSLLATENNGDLLSLALFGYLNVIPYNSQSIGITENAIDRLAILKQVNATNLFSYRFMLALNDNSGTLLAQLIQNLSIMGIDEAFRLNLIGVIDNGLRTTMLARPNQAIIDDYLQKAIKNVSENIANHITLTNSHDYYTLLKAYGEFNDDPSYLSKAILNINHKELLSGVLIAAFDDLTETKMVNELKMHRSELLKKLTINKTENLSKENDILLKIGINKLIAS